MLPYGRTWLLAIGRHLKADYDATAEPRTMMQAQHRSAHAATIRKEMRSQRMELRTVRRINGADLTLS